MESTTGNIQEARSLRSFIEAFFRHSRLFLGVLAVVVTVAIVYLALAKRQYESETKFLIQNARSTAVLSSDHSVSSASGDITEQQINSEMELLTSQDVLTKVADPAWLTLSAAEKTPERTHDHEDRITKFAKSFTMQAGRKSDIIQVSSTGDSPQQAFNHLQALTAAYLSQRKLLSRPNGTTAFFDEESRRYAAEWKAANQALVEFQQKNHLVSVPESETSTRQQLDRVEEDLRNATTALSESDRKLHEAILALTRVPQRQPTQQRTLENQYAVQQMRTMLVQLGNKRTELLTRYNPADRLITELDQQIADTNAALKEVTEGKGHEDTTDVNPVWQQLKGSISLEQVNHGAIEGRIRSLNQSVLNLQQQLGMTQQGATEYNTLKARADEAEENSKLFAQKHDQAQIEDAMDAHQLVNVAIAESPTLSFKAATPRPLRTGLLAMLTALVLATSIIALLEFTRSTTANARELEAFSSFPVLASLPLHTQSRHGIGESGHHGAEEFPGEVPLGDTATLIPVLQHLRTATER